jgi:hypothetical protein
MIERGICSVIKEMINILRGTVVRAANALVLRLDTRYCKASFVPALKSRAFTVQPLGGCVFYPTPDGWAYIVITHDAETNTLVRTASIRNTGTDVNVFVEDYMLSEALTRWNHTWEPGVRSLYEDDVRIWFHHYLTNDRAALLLSRFATVCKDLDGMYEVISGIVGQSPRSKAAVKEWN